MAWSYRITVRENLALEPEAWFEGLDLARNKKGQTILRGEFADQAELVGLLLRLHHLNVTLLALERLDRAGCAESEVPAIDV